MSSISGSTAAPLLLPTACNSSVRAYVHVANVLGYYPTLEMAFFMHGNNIIS